MNAPDLDFDGSWRDDLMQQQRAKFAAAETHDEQRAAADLIVQIAQWKRGAEASA